MKKLLFLIAFLFAVNLNIFAQTNCVENAVIVKPVLSKQADEIYTTNLEKAKADYTKSPNDADAIIWLGRRTAYLGKYKEAIAIFNEGIKKHPRDARMYRHRGHRLISIRCFDEAIKDFETAAKLVKGKADEIEHDGLPNERNIPTSTLQSNIFYHQGLAFYLKKDFANALKAYKNAEKVSTNPDMLVATKHWIYMTLRRLGKTKEAEKSIASIGDNLDIIENDDYYKLIKLYQGKLKAEDLMTQDANSLSNASLGYGLGNWFFYNGEKEKADKIFRQITDGNQWSRFGYIAAEVEPKMMQSRIFWAELQKLCGKAFAGTVANAPADDTTFKDKTLMMHVRSCEKNRIRIPFFVGEDKSRTWVLTFQNDRILLKHDHRHEDGTPDRVTMYGGWTTNGGMATRQTFPADQETADIIPAAFSNVWWIDLQPNEFFTYNLRRMGSERFFSIKFDLTKEIPAPSAPWGWKN